MLEGVDQGVVDATHMIFSEGKKVPPLPYAAYLKAIKLIQISRMIAHVSEKQESEQSFTKKGEGTETLRLEMKDTFGE